MAYVCATDLIDILRHEFSAEDDTDLCVKVLPPQQRKAKPGGLPLDFRSITPDFEDDNYSLECEATVDCASTVELLKENLRLRKVRNNKAANDDVGSSVDEKRKETKHECTQRTSDKDLFQYRNVKKSAAQRKVSSFAEYLESAEYVIDPEMSSYAKFAATEGQNGRKVRVFFPFADRLVGEKKDFSLYISALPQTRMSDLVGLICFEYTRSQRTPPIENIDDYQLLMAEEDGEVDRDLPPVDGHRMLCELGSCWSTVALVRRRMGTRSKFEMTTIIVHTITGHRYEFLLDSLNISLRWLRDQALQRRILDEGESFLSDCPALQEYVLETIDQRDVPLDLDLPISSAACKEFLILRINSSRGDFQPPGMLSTSMERPEQLNYRSRSSTPYDADTQLDTSLPTTTPLTLPSSSALDPFCAALAEYQVERLYKYKLNRSATLVLRDEGFELVPAENEKNRRLSSLFMHSPQRVVAITWDLVGGFETFERSNGKRIVKIYWLPLRKIRVASEVSRTSDRGMQKGESTRSATDSADSSLSEDLSRQVGLEDWKSLQLEASADDAVGITEKMSAILESRQSVVRQLYMAGSSKGPSKQNSPLTPSSPFGKRLSQVSSVVSSAMPSLRRLLSKRD